MSSAGGPLSPETVDIAVVGAGAAGLMTAIAAGRANPQGLRILLLDSRQKVGAKILISGGTRCNVTNVKVTPSDYEGGPRHFVKHVLEAFTPDETIRFFESIGVELVLEPTGKYFPTTHSGKTVLDALLKELGHVHAELKTGVKITEIKKVKELFSLKGRDASEEKGVYEVWARRVVLSTGGLSYPETGSDGTGFVVAAGLGHTLVETSPALTPLTTEDEDWKALSGITLDVKLSFYKRGKKEKEAKGSFLFTHFGFSGPAALDISRHFVRARREEEPRIEVSFLPEETEETLRHRLEDDGERHPQRLFKNYLAEEFLLPARFVETFFKKTGFGERRVLGRCTRPQRQKLIHLLLNYPLEVSGVIGYKKAEVTAGGLDLKEVNVSTMESRRAPGLYFAGEILDMDGRIGGFNFQWAWSSGTLAGRSAVRSLS